MKLFKNFKTRKQLKREIETLEFLLSGSQARIESLERIVFGEMRTKETLEKLLEPVGYILTSEELHSILSDTYKNEEECDV